MLPANFNLLSGADQQEFLALKDKFHAVTARAGKGERLDVLSERLALIRQFIERGDEDDSTRTAVCGIFFLRDSLAVNIQSLRILLGKCKSSINGSLQRLGYSAEPHGCDADEEFLSRVPGPLRQGSELRTWSIRRRAATAERRAPFVIQLPLSCTVGVETEAIEAAARRRFPCPIKCRYKYFDILQRSVSIQTDA